MSLSPQVVQGSRHGKSYLQTLCCDLYAQQEQSRSLLHGGLCQQVSPNGSRCALHGLHHEGLAKAGAGGSKPYVFCSRSCKAKAQRQRIGFETMIPSHYGTGTSDYRELVKDRLTLCEECGYKDCPGILQVHHRDDDHSNNAVVNLAVLCPNCHARHHFETRTGPWAPRK
mgnify:FL=1